MKQVARLHYGKALTAGTRKSGQVPVYGTNGQTGWHDTALASGPTVILGRKEMGNLGVKWCNGPFWVIDTGYYTSFRGDVEPRYFFFYVRHMGLNHLKDGTSNPSLSRDIFGRQLLPLPPIGAQRSIVRLLGSLDDEIELNRRMNETLEAMAQAIFKEWFVDFGPTRAKIGGRACYLSPEHWELFPDRLDERGKPQGWTTGPISSLASLVKRSLLPSLYPTEQFEHYSLPAFDNGQTPDSAVGSAILSTKTVIPANSVLLSKLNPEIPRVWLPATFGEQKAICLPNF